MFSVNSIPKAPSFLFPAILWNDGASEFSSAEILSRVSAAVYGEWEIRGGEEQLEGHIPG